MAKISLNSSHVCRYTYTQKESTKNSSVLFGSMHHLLDAPVTNSTVQVLFLVENNILRCRMPHKCTCNDQNIGDLAAECLTNALASNSPFMEPELYLHNDIGDWRSIVLRRITC